MAYIDVLRSGNVDLLKQLSDTALGNMKNVFKGIPAVPEYVADGEKIGDWELRYQKPRDTIGYFFPVSMSHGGIALLKDGKTWMSLTPLELESHMLPVNAAKGHVVVAGLGLGMITLNLLAKQSVRKLTLLEIDGELIDNFPALLAGESRKLWEDAIATGRLQVLQVDCKRPFSKVVKDAIGRVDYMWVDIWPTLGSYEALEDTRFLCKQLKPRVCDYWGIELDVISIMNENQVSADTSGVFKSIETLGIPASPLSFSKIQKNVYKGLVVMAGAHVVFASGLS